MAAVDVASSNDIVVQDGHGSIAKGIAQRTIMVNPEVTLDEGTQHVSKERSDPSDQTMARSLDPQEGFEATEDEAFFLRLSSFEIARRANIGIERLKHVLQDVQDQCTSLAASHGTLTRLHQDLQGQHEALKQLNIAEANKRENQQIELNGLQERVRTYETTARDKEMEVQTLQHALTERTQHNSKLESMLQDCREALASQIAKLRTSEKQQVEQGRAQYKSAQAIANLQQEIKSRDLQVKELRDGLTLQQTRMQDQQGRLDKERVQRESQDQEIARLRSLVAATQKQLESRISQVNYYHTAEDRQRSELVEQAHRIASQIKQLDTYQDEISRRQQKVEAAEGHIRKLNNQVSDMLQQKIERDANARQLSKMVDQLRSKVESHESDLQRAIDISNEGRRSLDVEIKANKALRSNLIIVQDELAHLRNTRAQLLQKDSESSQLIDALRIEIEALQSSSQHRIPSSSNLQQDNPFELPPFNPFQDLLGLDSGIVVDTPQRPSHAASKNGIALQAISAIEATTANLSETEVVQTTGPAETSEAAQIFFDQGLQEQVSRVGPEKNEEGTTTAIQKPSDTIEQDVAPSDQNIKTSIPIAPTMNSIENRLAQALHGDKTPEETQSQQVPSSPEPVQEAAAADSIVPINDHEQEAQGAQHDEDSDTDANHQLDTLLLPELAPKSEHEMSEKVSLDRSKIKQSNRCTRCIELKRYCDGEPQCEECKMFYVSHELPEQYCNYPFVAKSVAMSKITPADYIPGIMVEEMDSALAALQLKRAAKFWRAATETDYPALKPTIIDDEVRPLTASTNVDSDGPLRLTRLKRKSLFREGNSRDSTPSRKQARTTSSPSVKTPDHYAMSANARFKSVTVSPESSRKCKVDNAPIKTVETSASERSVRGNSPVVQDSQDNDELPMPVTFEPVQPSKAQNTEAVSDSARTKQSTPPHNEDLESDSEDDEIFASANQTRRLIPLQISASPAT